MQKNKKTQFQRQKKNSREVEEERKFGRQGKRKNVGDAFVK
jgi:hypothetical protein